MVDMATMTLEVAEMGSETDSEVRNSATAFIATRTFTIFSYWASGGSSEYESTELYIDEL